MLALMKLELRTNNIHTYLISASVLFVIMLGFIYLLAYVPKFDPHDPDLYLFVGYDNIVPLFGAINMTVFCVLGAVMYARFVIETYTGKGVIRLFSYPIKRGRIFVSKVLVVAMFIMIAMVVCNLLIFTIFGLSESFFPVVDERMTSEFMINAVKITLMMSITAAGLSILAMGLGFIMKSIPATIISAILLCSIFCNIVAGSLASSDIPIILFMILTILGSTLVIGIITHKINTMEV